MFDQIANENEDRRKRLSLIGVVVFFAIIFAPHVVETLFPRSNENTVSGPPINPDEVTQTCHAFPLLPGAFMSAGRTDANDDSVVTTIRVHVSDSSLDAARFYRDLSRRMRWKHDGSSGLAYVMDGGVSVKVDPAAIRSNYYEIRCEKHRLTFGIYD